MSEVIHTADKRPPVRVRPGGSRLHVHFLRKQRNLICQLIRPFGQAVLAIDKPDRLYEHLTEDKFVVAAVTRELRVSFAESADVSEREHDHRLHSQGLIDPVRMRCLYHRPNELHDVSAYAG